MAVANDLKLKAAVDGHEESPAVNRFGQIRFCSQRQCAVSSLGGVMPGDHHRPYVRVTPLQMVLHFEAAELRHVQIEDETFRRVVADRMQELGTRCENLRGKPRR